MAHHHNVLLRVEFLVETRWNLAHRDVLASRNLRSLDLPRLAHIQQRDRVARILQRLQLATEIS